MWQWDGGRQLQALGQLLASLEPPDPSSPPEWVLPLPNTVGEWVDIFMAAGLQVTHGHVASMVTGDIRELRRDRSRLSALCRMHVSLLPYWHHTWLLKQRGTKQKCASAKIGQGDSELWPPAAGEEAQRANVVLSLLCLWPYGNSLISCCDSEFYQCHTQNRSQCFSPPHRLIPRQ